MKFLKQTWSTFGTDVFRRLSMQSAHWNIYSSTENLVTGVCMRIRQFLLVMAHGCEIAMS